MNEILGLKSRRDVLAVVVSGGLYCVLVAGLHWDALCHLSSHILAGGQVGGLFIWEFWWFKLSFAHGSAFNPFFSPLIFFPIGSPIVVQTPLLLGIALLLQHATNVYAVYNLLYMFAYVGSGLGMMLLAHHVSRDYVGSFVAGFVFMFGQYSLTEHIIGHLNYATLLFIPIVFIGLLEMAGPWPARGAAVFFAGLLGSSLVSIYFVFELTMVGIPTFFLWLWFSKDRIAKRNEFLIRGTIAFSLALGLAALFYWPLLLYGHSFIGGSDVSSLSLFSFVDFPAWHPVAFIKRARAVTTGFGEVVSASYNLL
jgi:hypothetical protein